MIRATEAPPTATFQLLVRMQSPCD
jgi:hypothetical protein